MNHSFYSVDRTTHLKIVVLALVSAIAIVGISIATHADGVNAVVQADHVRVVKAGQPATLASNNHIALR
jgi:hypothetical protein